VLVVKCSDVLQLILTLLQVMSLMDDPESVPRSSMDSQTQINRERGFGLEILTRYGLSVELVVMSLLWF